MHKLVVFSSVYQITILTFVNAYVLFAANLDDFKSLAKKMVPDDLAEELTQMASQKSMKSHDDDKQVNVRPEAEVDEVEEPSLRENNQGVNIDEIVEKVKEKLEKDYDKTLKTRYADSSANTKYSNYEGHGNERHRNDNNENKEENYEKRQSKHEDDDYSQRKHENYQNARPQNEKYETQRFNQEKNENEPSRYDYDEKQAKHEKYETQQKRYEDDDNQQSRNEETQPKNQDGYRNQQPKRYDDYENQQQKHGVYENQQQQRDVNENQQQQRDVYENQQQQRDEYENRQQKHNVNENQQQKERYEDYEEKRPKHEVYEKNQQQIREGYQNQQQSHQGYENQQQRQQGYENQQQRQQGYENQQQSHQGYENQQQTQQGFDNQQQRQQGYENQQQKYQGYENQEQSHQGYKNQQQTHQGYQNQQPKRDQKYDYEDAQPKHERYQNEQSKNNENVKVKKQKIPNYDDLPDNVNVEQDTGTKPDDTEIFSQVSLVKHDSYEDYVVPKKDNPYESDEKQTKQAPKDKVVEKETQFNDYEEENQPNSNINTEKLKEKQNGETGDVQARTENLFYEDIASEHPNRAGKNTMIPTKRYFRFSSPNYYVKLSTPADKYNFDEPLPEKDRQKEDMKHFPNPPAHINGKVALKI